MSALSRRAVLAGTLALPAGAARAAAPGLKFSGRFTQGSAVIGRAAPRAEITVEGGGAVPAGGAQGGASSPPLAVGKASANGLFIIGFDRDAGKAASIGARIDGGSAQHKAAIAPVKYDIQRVNGLPQDTVTPQGDALLARIAEESKRKQAGFASNADADWFADGFAMPLANYRVSGRFGGQRILNGTPSTPHYGADLAAPIGTPILAPGKALVAFAETGLFYEGGLILLDHGQGLVTAYLHMSKVEVTKGEMVERGQKMGEVGMEGRATGPHLCWRMKWRARNCDPTLLVGVQAPST